MADSPDLQPTNAAPRVGLSVGDSAAVVRESPLPCFMVGVPNGAMLSTSPGLAALLGSTVGDLAGRPVWDILVEGPTGILDLLATGAVEGVELRRTLKRVDGSSLPVRMSLTRLTLEDGTRCALAVASTVASENQLGARPVAGLVQRPLIIGTVDESWRVDRITCDIDALLGHAADAALGRSILTVIHPGDLPALLTNVAKAVERSTGIALSLRLITADGGWQACDVLVSPLPEPPSFAFVIAPTQTDQSRTLSRTEQDLWDLALGAQAVNTSRRAAKLPGQHSIPGLDRLSTRELEIIMRLMDGKRVPAIAGELFLSQGTIRNHLSSAFHKLGVRSQQELLDLLRRP